MRKTAKKEEKVEKKEEGGAMNVGDKNWWRHIKEGPLKSQNLICPET